MSRTEVFITKEKEYYGKIYADVAFAIDEVRSFIEESTLKNRKYYSRQGILDKYMELLNTAEAESKKKGLFGGLFESDKYINLLNDYKNDHREEIEQLKNCANCQCLKCTAICKFDSCNGCKNSKHIASCDHQRTNVAFFDNSPNSILKLVNNNTGMEDSYTILAIVQDALEDKRYILIENLRDKERFILYYIPKLPEDSYGEILDEEDFNFAATAYENVER